MFFSNKHRYLYIFLLSLYTYINTELCQVYTYFQIDIGYVDAFIIILIITFLVWEINRLLNPLFIKWFPNPGRIIKRNVLSFFIGLVLAYVATIGVDLFFSKIVFHQLYSSILNPLKLTLIYTSLINLLFNLINLVYVYQDQLRKKELEADGLQRMNMQAELQTIRNQINPHFLFNNLNVLSGLVMQKSNDANKFIEAFSKLYMHILQHQDKELIELRKELDFLEPYIYLLKQRFPDSIDFNVEVPYKYNNHYIIPVALQMLVENAIKHNISSKNKPLQITIYANGNQSISVINNIQPKTSKQTSSNIGLSNIRKRYEYATGKSIIIDQENGTFSVTLPLIEVNNYESINN